MLINFKYDLSKSEIQIKGMFHLKNICFILCELDKSFDLITKNKT